MMHTWILAVLMVGRAVSVSEPGIPPAHTLLVTSVRTGDTEIFAVDPLTGSSQNLTRSPQSEDRYPAWAPDGRQVAFTSNRADTATYDLYLMDANGTSPRRLTQLPAQSVAYWPSFSQNGKWIYFNEGTSGYIYRVKPDGTGLMRVAEGRDGHISPDGANIVFTQMGEKGFGVWVMAADGSGRMQVVDHESEIGGIAPVWSPDGKQIAFSGQVGEFAEIFTCQADGSSLTQVTHLEKISSSPAFSPDGKYLTFRVTDEAYWRDAAKRAATYHEKAADKRPVWLLELASGHAELIETLHYQCAMDGSRAEWKPLTPERKK